MDKLAQDEILNSIIELEKMDYTSSDKIETKAYPLVSVLMTTFNVEKYIEEAVNSILTQSYKNIELIIVDDASTDGTIDLIKGNNDPRVQLFQNKMNSGTYYSKNYGITQSNGKYIAIQDSDDVSDQHRIKKQVEYLESLLNKQYVMCQYTRFDEDGSHLIKPRLAFQSSMIRRSVFDEIGFYDCVRAAGDDEFNARMMLYYGHSCRGVIEELLYFNRQREDSLTSVIEIGSSPRTTYVKNYKKWHETLKGKGQKIYVPYPLENRPFPVENKIEVVYNSTLNPESNIKKVKLAGEWVTASMVSIPSRESLLNNVVSSIIEQVDELNIYLNDYDTVPAFLNHKKIKVFQSQEHGDIADNGKFFKASTLKGFHFTVDDDILYPSDYVDSLRSKLKEYAYETGVGVHGITIREGFKSYYDQSSRNVISFYNAKLNDSYVHILGTGTLAYHTNTINFDLRHISDTHMVDIYLALYCQKNSVPLICVQRNQAWLKELETPDETRIYNNFAANDNKQTALIKSITWDYQYLSFDIKENINFNLTIEERMLRKLESFEELLIENEKTIANQRSTINKYENDLTWYDATYKHLPKWFLKIGGIFRRL